MNLMILRKEIDLIDQSIASLIARRSALSQEIGVLKSQAGLPVHDDEREQEVLAKVNDENWSLSESRSIRNIFVQIIAESRKMQSDFYHLEARPASGESR